MECTPKPHGVHASWQKTTAATELPEGTDEWPGCVLDSISAKNLFTAPQRIRNKRSLCVTVEGGRVRMSFPLAFERVDTSLKKWLRRN
jgi:hypothetical protein